MIQNTTSYISATSQTATVVKVVCKTANEHHNLDTAFLPQLNGRIRLVASAVESKKIFNHGDLVRPNPYQH